MLMISSSKCDPNSLYINRHNKIKFRGKYMFFPHIKEEVMSRFRGNDADGRDDSLQIYSNHMNNEDPEVIRDNEAEDYWSASYLPGIIQDVNDYEAQSVSARTPYETDQQYEERLMMLMDITYPDMDQLEADIDMYLAEMI